MIFKHFLMGFGGVATVTGVGIGIYYGTNSSENARQDVESLEIKVPEDTKSGEEKIEPSQKGPLDTEELVTSTDGGSQPNPSTK